MSPRPVLSAVCCLALALFLAGVPTLRATADDDDGWSVMLETLRKQSRIIHTRLDAFKQHRAAEAAKQAETLERLLRDRARLALWQAMASDPWEIRDVLAGFARLGQAIDRHSERPRQAWATLEDTTAALDGFRERLYEIAQQEVPERFRQALAPVRQTIADLGAEIAAEREAIAEDTRPLRNLTAQTRAAEEAMQASLAPAWKQYYSQVFPIPLSSSYLRILGHDLEDWGLWSQIGLELLPARQNRLLLARGVILGLMAALAATVTACAVHRLARRRGQPPATLGIIARSGVCVASGMLFLVMANNAPFFLFTPLASIGEILMTAAMVHLSRLRRACDPPASRPPLLWPTWRLFALGLLLEAFRVPETLMSPLMAVILAGSSLIFLRRLKGAPAHSPLERNVARALAVLLPLLAALSFCGLPQTAILCASGLFYVVLALRFATATIHFIERREIDRHHGHPSLLFGILAGAGTPFFFLAYLFLFLWLLSTQFGGENVFLELLTAETRIESVGISLEKIAALLGGFYAVRALLALSRTFIETLGGRRRGVERGARASLLTINTYLWWGLYVLFAMTVLGLSLTSVAVVAGGLSVGIGFGLQTMVNNFVSGLILLFGRSVQAGDTIQLGDALGVVKEVNIRNTEVLTKENATVFVPNSELVSGKIINWSHKDPSVRRDIAVGVAYGSDTARVRELLLEAARACPAVLRDPAPSVLHWDFGASTLDFRLRVWLADVDGAVTAMSAIREAIDRLFREAGIEFAYPHTDVHLRSAPALEHLLETHLEGLRAGLAGLAARVATLENPPRPSTVPDDGEK